jgi:putative nucleotidyltransferase with HDIG domain
MTPAAPQDAAARIGVAVECARSALADREAYVVGGVVRDRLLGRSPLAADVDIVLAGDVESAAKALRGRTAGAVFALSDEFGAWRFVARDGWQIDFAPLAGDGIDADLRARDLTINAIAEPLAGGDPIDPTGGVADLAARVLRMTAPAAFKADALRTLRVARFVSELGFDVDEATVAAARSNAPGLAQVSPERVFAELKRLLVADGAVAGLGSMADLGVTDVVLPELTQLRGIEQNRFHHLDVHDHTLAALAELIELERDPGAVFGELGPAVADVLESPFADELTTGGALRFGALLHDIAKPATRAVTPDGHVTFFHHHTEGAEMARSILARLRASERLRAFVAAIARHHLRAGFLVKHQPLDGGAIYDYLDACEPVEVEVTILGVADRLATRGDNAQAAIEAHLELARTLLAEALRWRAEGPPEPLIRGDELAQELGVTPGPALGELVAALRRAQFTGEVGSREEAIAFARGVAGE